MDARELADLLASGESLTVEFKAKVNDAELVEAVVCLSNGSGGFLLLGVADDGTVVGAPPRHPPTTDPDRLRALLAGRTEPAVVVGVELFTRDGREVVVIEVPQAGSVVGTKDGRFVRRVVGTDGRPMCQPMRAFEVVGRAGSLGERDYSAVALSGVGEHVLDPAEIDRFRRLATEQGDGALELLSDGDLLSALGLVTLDGELTVGAVVLFGRADELVRLVPTHETAFQVLEDLEVRTNVVEHQPLVRSMLELVERVDLHNPEEEVEVGLFRLPLPRFADVAVRELVANALVHRDYTRMGAVRIQLDEGALQVSDPGGFPAGITKDNVLTAPPRPRNPLIADAFERAGLVERTGRGVNRVFESQLSLGRPAPDFGRSTEDEVVARLRSGPADRELAAYIAESRRAGQRFSVEDLLVLHEVRAERRTTTGRVAELFNSSHEEARSVLNGLVERGMLEARGESRGRTYHLAAALYRRFGDPTAYVRTRGFDLLQQQQMVLTFVEQHGEITRQQAAELCQLEPDQASRLLRGLRDDGRLIMVGNRRSARYVLPEG